MLLLQGIYSSIKTEDSNDGINSDKSKLLEWTLAFTLIGMLVSIAFDSVKFEMVYTEINEEDGWEIEA